ncbi:DUF5926 family protein [Calidifontibacter terrae]
MGKAARRKAERMSAGKPPKVATAPYVGRPFEGLPNEGQWVALRELISAGTAPLTVQFDGESHDVTLASVLPMAWPALKRDDGQVLVALQSGVGSGDASRDIAETIRAAIALEPGVPLETPPQASAESPRLQDIVTSTELAITLQEGFDFWVEGQELDAEGQESMLRANEAISPTYALTSADGAYWTKIGDRTFIRWVLEGDEDAGTNAIARLHAAGESGLGEGRFLGAFRAYGLLVPVWEVPAAAAADSHEDGMAALRKRFETALAVTEPLTADERRARAGVVGRQITLR